MLEPMQPPHVEVPLPVHSTCMHDKDHLNIPKGINSADDGNVVVVEMQHDNYNVDYIITQLHLSIYR